MIEDILTGIILNEENTLTLNELSRACMVHSEWIIELVDEGILEPKGEEITHWRFSGTCLKRARTVRRLQQDLGVNLAGSALALNLIDEIEGLRARLNEQEKSS